MPCIKRKYGCGFVYLYPKRMEGKFKLCGTTIDTYVSKSLEPKEFNGFIDYKEANPIDPIIVTNIVGYNPADHLDSKLWVKTEDSDWMLGHKLNNGVVLVIQNDRPVIINRLKYEDDPRNFAQQPIKNNVTDITAYK